MRVIAAILSKFSENPDKFSLVAFILVIISIVNSIFLSKRQILCL